VGQPATARSSIWTGREWLANDSATHDRRADDRPVTDAARAAQKLEFRVTVRTVPRLGTPVLRLVASELDLEHTDRSWLRSLVEDLVDTMRDQNGVGIAAPQVGVSLRIFAIEVRPDNPRYENEGDVPLRIAINPRLEGCAARGISDFCPKLRISTPCTFRWH